MSVSTHVKLLLKILFSATAFVWLALRIDWAAWSHNLAGLNLGLFGLSLIIFFLTILPCSLRWHFITAACGFPIGFGEAMRYYLIGNFFNAFLPTARGGDLARGVLASKENRFRLGGVIGSILIERIVGLVTAMVFVLLTGIHLFSRRPVLKPIILSALVVFALASFVLLSAAHSRVRRFGLTELKKIPFRVLRDAADDIVAVFAVFLRQPRLVAWTLVLTLVNQLILVASGFLAGAAIPGFRVPATAFFFVIPLSFFAAILPSVGGFGIREAGYVLFWSWFAVPGELGGLYAFAQFVFFTVSALLGTLVFVFTRSRANRPLSPAA